MDLLFNDAPFAGEKELQTLLTRVRRLRDEYGVKVKGSDRGFIDCNTNTADAFLLAKTNAVDKYKLIKGLINERRALDAAGKDSKAVIILTLRIRTEVRLVINRFQRYFTLRIVIVGEA